MSEKPYDKLSHREGALRRVYQARRSLSHVDAGVVYPEDFQLLAEIVEDLEELERRFEERNERARIERAHRNLQAREE
jgi:hypothetical protein